MLARGVACRQARQCRPLVGRVVVHVRTGVCPGPFDEGVDELLERDLLLHPVMGPERRETLGGVHQTMQVLESPAGLGEGISFDVVVEVAGVRRRKQVEPYLVTHPPDQTVPALARHLQPCRVAQAVERFSPHLGRARLVRGRRERVDRHHATRAQPRDLVAPHARDEAQVAGRTPPVGAVRGPPAHPAGRAGIAPRRLGHARCGTQQRQDPRPVLGGEGHDVGRRNGLAGAVAEPEVHVARRRPPEAHERVAVAGHLKQGRRLG